MSLFEPRTVLNSLWPSLAIIWAFGNASFRVNRLRRILYALMMTAIMVYVNVYTMGIKFSSTHRKLIDWISSVTSYLKVPSGLVSIWLWELRIADAVGNAIEEMSKLDEELKNFGLLVNHKKFMWKQLVTIGGFLTLYLTVSTLQHSALIDLYDSPIAKESFAAHLVLTIDIHMNHFQSLMGDLVFAMMLEAFRTRFKLVDKVFERIAESEERTNVKVFTTSYSRILDVSSEKSQERHGKRVSNRHEYVSTMKGDDQSKPYAKKNNIVTQQHLSSHLVMERVDRACRIHRRLLKIAQDVGDAFSFHTCVSYPNFLLHVMLEAFMLVSFFSDHRQEEYTSANTNVILVTYTVGRFWQLVASCSNTVDEANKLGTSLYRIPIDDAAVHNQLQEYSVHIIQRKLRFTIGGILDIDRNLAKNVFSTVMKYVVILLQFRKSV